MLMNGLDGQITTACRCRIRQRGQELGLRARRRGAVECQLMHHRFAAPAHEVVLEIDPALVGANARAHRIVAHRQHARSHAKPRAQVCGDRRQRFAGPQPARALDMHGEIAVAQSEPGLAAKRRQRLHERPGLVADGPSRVPDWPAPASVYITVSISGEMDSPRCSKSSPVLATTSSSSAGSTRLRPSASLAPPTPPDSAITVTGTGPPPAGGPVPRPVHQARTSRGRAPARPAAPRPPGLAAAMRRRRSRRQSR